MYCNVGVITFISEERRNTHCSTRSIVKGKLGQQKESFPVILLVVAVHMQILFQSLVCSFSLSIAFGMISGSKVKLHIFFKAFLRDLKKWEMNSGPRSDVTWAGTPCLENTWITKSSASCVDMMVSWVAMKIACFVSRSTITNIEVYPEEDGN